MIFTKHPTVANYYLPETPSNVDWDCFLFVESTSATLDLTNLFNSPQGSFLLVFYTGEIDYSNEAANAFKNIVRQSRRILWIQSFSPNNIELSPFISFNNNNVVDSFVANFGNADYKLYVDKLYSASRLRYARGEGILCEVTNGRDYGFFANNQSNPSDEYASFSKFVIPLRHRSRLIDFTTTVESNFGAIVFKTDRFVGTAVQPVAPFIYTKNGSERIVAANFFYEASFRESVDLFVTLFPFDGFENDSDFLSHCEYAFKASVTSVKWNGVDNFGANFEVRQLTGFRSRLAKIHIESQPDYPRYLFIPDFEANGKLRLVAGNKKSEMLLGYSGTESISVGSDDYVDITFKRSEKIKVNAQKNGFVESSTGSAKSITSWISLDHLTDYKLDSEKSPQFPNTPTPARSGRRRTIKPNVVEKAYGYLKKREIAGEFPFIPTLSFKDNPELRDEIEPVISTVRKNQNPERKYRAAYSATDQFITPQGFLRKGNRLDFIKKVPASRSKKNVYNAENNESRFTINIVKDDRNDFDLSIAKEDVFFVTTPKILSDALARGSQVKYDITFGIKGFRIDLTNYIGKDPADSDRIVIFKFSKRSFSELLDDTSKWTNAGNFRPDGLEAVKKAIKAQIDGFPQDSEDYAYFRDIQNNKNWNGVIILNVPISDAGDLPPVVGGLASSQKIRKDENSVGKLNLETELKFQFVAFPVNKTEIQGDGAVGIKSTSFYGLIDYDLFQDTRAADYKAVAEDLKTDRAPTGDFFRGKFYLTKLLAKFDNSLLTKFTSFAFFRMPELFSDNLNISAIPIKHANTKIVDGHPLKTGNNLITLSGSIQKNEVGSEEIVFKAEGEVVIPFTQTSVIEKITLKKVGISYVNDVEEFDADAGKKIWKRKFLFDFDATFDFHSSIKKYLSVKFLNLKNFGFSFAVPKVTAEMPKPRLPLPNLTFDLSTIAATVDIDYDKLGFLSSFPLKFNRFQLFKGTDIKKFDFFSIFNNGVGAPDSNLFGLIFEMDLGTLGSLGGLKALKAEILLGWSPGGGIRIGIKFMLPNPTSLHIDLFGALKLDIDRIELCSFKPSPGEAETFFLKLVNARLTIMGLKLPPDKYEFHGIVYASPKNKIAWFIALNEKGKKEKRRSAEEKGGLLIGVGQRVGVDATNFTRVEQCITQIKKVFNTKTPACGTDSNSEVMGFYKPDRNWLVASENPLPAELGKFLDLKFIFNDPALYGVHIGIHGEVGAFLPKIDILYKKISENLGVWAIDLELPPIVRNIDVGGGSVTLPNIGIEIYTNGDHGADIGYPWGGDFSRSCLIQIRPFIGWGGFYYRKTKVASLSLFARYIDSDYSQTNLEILQAGFALRIGLGAYINKGIFSAGASLTVFGILEGAFAFDKTQPGLQKLFPHHFALQGTIGAIAEVVGYVDFIVQKIAIHIVLRVEIGVLLVYLGKDNVPGENTKRKGLQPVNLYIEGQVTVEIDFTIACFKIFRKRICITVHFSFDTKVRFQYTLGSGGSATGLFLEEERVASRSLAAGRETLEIRNITKIPVIYIPSVTKTNETAANSLKLVHNFVIPLFGKKAVGGKVEFTVNHVFKEIIQGIFEPLIEKIKAAGKVASYSNLRSILQSGRLGDLQIEITFPEYRPWFIAGYQIDQAADESLLTEVFKFDAAEAAEFRRLNANICENDPASCPFRFLSAPISPDILVSQRPNLTKPVETKGGFEIEIHNLVKNGVDNSVKAAINELPHDKAKLAKIESYFNDYKTQFVARQGNTIASDSKDEVDLRKSVIIPEYFKLIGLLTLDYYYHKIVDHYKNDPNWKKSPEEAPELQNLTAALIAYTKPKKNTRTRQTPLAIWDLNDKLQDIVGQINYFFTNGLRLPDVKATPSRPTTPERPETYPTKSYFSVLMQESPITNKGAGDVRVLLKRTGHVDLNITNEVMEAQEIADFRALVDDFGDNAEVDLNRLSNAYRLGDIKAFELKPVSLAIPNNPLKISSKERFFPMPGKLIKDDDRKKYRIKLNLAEQNKTVSVKDKGLVNPVIESPAYTVCTNVEFKVRVHASQQTNVRLMEISNVKIEDLALMNKINANPSFIKKIGLYLRNGNELVSLFNNKATVIKTNLTTKTHPPLIYGVRLLKSRHANLEFIADSQDPASFVKLIWEGVTTNNGGYFIVLDRDNSFAGYDPEKPSPLYDIVLSLENERDTQTGVSSPFPAFSNFIKVKETNESANCDLPKDDRCVFNKLNANTHYLFIDLLKENLSKTEPVPVVEYHSKMPPHCYGFELSREKQIVSDPQKNARYSHYQPIEFEVKNDTQYFLTKDNVLPLMPQDEGTKLIYRHVTPLQKINNIANKERYAAVGRRFSFRFSQRDVYGFRAVDLAAKKLDYEHVYFDKLVPVEAWPLIKLSYWLKSFAPSSSKFSWDLNLKVELTNLLPLLGIDEKAVKEGVVPEKVLSQSRGAIDSVLEKLYTVQAQIFDEKVSVVIPRKDYNFNLKVFLLDNITKAINALESFRQNGRVPTVDLQDSRLLYEEVRELKSLLNVEIQIERVKEHCIKDNLLTKDVWDFESVRCVKSSIKLEKAKVAAIEDPAEAQSLLKDLDRELRLLPNCPYCLGVSTNANREKEIYLINKKLVEEIQIADAQPLSTAHYFGILPYSNQLWSGIYEFKSRQYAFTNIDLDVSLRVVLAKIDELLNPSFLITNLVNNSKEELDSVVSKIDALIIAKKKLAKELSEKVENVDDKETSPETLEKIKKEFRDLLADRLNRFYEFDGIIKTSVTRNTLGEHRLTFDFGKIDNYEIVSSKLSGNNNDWIIMFDQVVQESTVNLTLKPKVTHIEFGIDDVTGSDIESSNWIQIIEPIKLINSVNVDSTRYPWHTVIRKFPPKPVILEHRAQQNTLELSSLDEFQVHDWNPNELGKWNYKLDLLVDSLADSLNPSKRKFEVGDKMEINLHTKSLPSLRARDDRSFMGFIALWSGKILASGNQNDENVFDWREFVEDLSAQSRNFGRTKVAEKAEPSITICIKYVKPTGSQALRWVKETVKGIETDRVLVNQSETPSPRVTISVNGFKLFKSSADADPSRIASILSEARVLRNQDLKNTNFQYKTEFVQSPSWTTPQITYSNIIKVPKTGDLQWVVEAARVLNLPYKMTLKHALDLGEFGDATLPSIPVRQIECNPLSKPRESIETYFDDKSSGLLYKNGNYSLSLTIYNNDQGESDLPIFHADIIKKDK